MILEAPAELEGAEAVTLEAIYTFTDGPQRIEYLPLIGIASEANALFAVLSRLSENERQALLKVSLCLYCNAPDESEWLWLNESRGKYYFTATTPETESEPPRIDPALVEDFKRDPSNRTARAVIAAVEAVTCAFPHDTRLEDGPQAGLVLRGGDGRFLFHIGRDGRLNAVPDSAPAAEVRP